MATIPQKFPEQPEAAIASYDYTDIAEGTGVVSLYGFAVDTDFSGSYDYGLSNNQIYSSAIYTSGSTISGAMGSGESFNKNLDSSPFNLPKSIKGTAYATIPLAVSYGPSGEAHAQVTLSLQKYDGTNAIEFASGSTAYEIYVTPGRYLLPTIKIPINSIQHFKKGEILRANISSYCSSTPGNFVMSFAHDPKDRSGPGGNYEVPTDIDSTMLKLDIPFRLDL